MAKPLAPLSVEKRGSLHIFFLFGLCFMWTKGLHVSVIKNLTPKKSLGYVIEKNLELVKHKFVTDSMLSASIGSLF